jgi:hypothetical protein
MAETKPARPEIELLGEIGRYHVRRIKKLNGQQMLDIRERVQGSTYSGYTRKGIMLSIPGELEKLRSLLDSIR